MCSGGIKLQLTGKNLDVAQQPRMLFAGGNKTIQVLNFEHFISQFF